MSLDQRANIQHSSIPPSSKQTHYTIVLLPIHYLVNAINIWLVDTFTKKHKLSLIILFLLFNKW